MGISVSIDDFGTGYSSLGYLKRFPIDTSRSTARSSRTCRTTPTTPRSRAPSIAMAHSLRMKVVAEGVETREQLEFLRAHGCDECQGYYFSRPLPAAEFALLARAWGRDHATLRVVPRRLTSAA